MIKKTTTLIGFDTKPVKHFSKTRVIKTLGVEIIAAPIGAHIKNQSVKYTKDGFLIAFPETNQVFSVTIAEMK